MMRFEAKLDDLSKILSFVVIGILIIPAVLIGNIAAHGTPLVLVPLLLTFGALAVGAMFRITGYEITADELLIRRPAGTVHLQRRELVSATPVTTKELGLGLRTFGSGGWFGWFGKFWYKNVGHATLYATDRTKFILLKTTTGKNVIVSPVDGTSFLQALALPAAPLA